MIPIFFAWKGDYSDLVATGFQALGGRTRTVALTHGSAYIGIIEAENFGARNAAAALDAANPDFVLLPGPNSNLTAAHVAAIVALWPKAPIKEGDPMRTVLSHVMSLYGDAEFDPDGY